MLARTRPHRWLAVASALVVMSLAVACGGDGGGEPVEDATITIDRTYWHAGFQVRLTEATAASREGGRRVTIVGEFTNLRDGPSSYSSLTVLNAGGESYENLASADDLPRMPRNTPSPGTFVFDVSDNFAFDDAFLVIGSPSNNQAIVPLGQSAPAQFVSLEPRQIEVGGALTAGAVTLQLEGGELRADVPDLSNEVQRGYLALTIRFSATAQPGLEGLGELRSENVALQLPGGTLIGVRSDGGDSGVFQVLRGHEGAPIPGLNVRFEIPEPVQGEYAFVLKGDYGPQGSNVEAALPFQIAE
jgi:hypothetical protein